jgi:hypothetical protein
MSITILQQPVSRLLSAGNDNIYTVSGNTLGAANVFDYMFVADLYVSGVLEVTLKAFPDPTYGFGVFNLRDVAQAYLGYDFFDDANDIPNCLSYQCPNTGKQMQFCFGEQYTSGSTFVNNRLVTSGNAEIVINASLSFPEQSEYSLQGSLINRQSFSNTTTIIPSVLSDKPLNPGNNAGGFLKIGGNLLINWNFKGYTNLRQWQYIVIDKDSLLTHFSPAAAFQVLVEVNTYDANGVNLEEYIAPYPYTLNPSVVPISGVTSYVWAVYTGYPQLVSVTSGVTFTTNPTYPVMLSNPLAAYYVMTIFVQMGGSTLVRPNGPFTVGPSMVDPVYTNPQYYGLYQIMRDCGRFATTAYSIYWLNEVGGFNSWLFNKKNETTQNKQTQSFKRIPGKLQPNGSYTLNTYDGQNEPYFTVLQDTIEMTTDFLTDDEALYLKGLVSSPVVYMEDQNGLTTRIIIDQNSYRINKKVNQKIYTFKMNISQSYNDYRQTL